MAQPQNTYDQYDANGLKEDVSDVIYDTSPWETPFFSSLRKIKVTQRQYEWQTDALRSSANNAHIEGDDTTADAITPTVSRNNQCQIFKNSYAISGTMEKVSTYGRSKESAYQKVKIGREQKLDIERALFDNNAKVAGDSATPRELAGVPTWLTTNTDAGTGGSDATGDGSDARTDGTQRAFTETQTTSVLQSIWENGGNPDTVYLSASNQTIAAGFEGNAPRRHTESGDGVVNNFIDVYVTSWGRVELVPSREVRARDVLILQSDMWSFGEFRPMFTEPLAKTGDSIKAHMITEGTLISNNERASGGVFDTGG